MSLPASGQIAFSDVRTEMSQSAISYYNIGGWGIGYGTYTWSENTQFTPINVHADNTGKYSTDYSMSMSDWYGYNRSANYASDGTQRDLFLSFSPTISCFPTSMLVFDAGTTNKTLDIFISGSAADFDYAASIVAFYGKPWYNDGQGIGGTVIYASSSLANGLNHTETYSYTYDSNVGQYIYVVLYGNCP